MQDVFSKNPKMGDPASLAPQLDENSRTLDQLQQEIRKYEVRHDMAFHFWIRTCSDIIIHRVLPAVFFGGNFFKKA